MPTWDGNKSALHFIGNKGILESLSQKQMCIWSSSSSGKGFFKLVWLSNWLLPLLWGSSIFCLPQFPPFQLHKLPQQKKYPYQNRPINGTILWSSVGPCIYSHEELELSPGLSVKPSFSHFFFMYIISRKAPTMLFFHVVIYDYTRNSTWLGKDRLRFQLNLMCCSTLMQRQWGQTGIHERTMWHEYYYKRIFSSSFGKVFNSS